MARQRIAAFAAVLALAPLLSACSLPRTASDGRVQVVTSTDVYADIVRAVGGSAVDVTAFIDNPAQDPHSFQASARDQLAVARADVIVENGGGYDDFMDRMRRASAKPGSVTLDVVALSGHRAGPGSDVNEHVWYDVAAVGRFVARLSAVLAARRPALAARLHRDEARYQRRLRGLRRTEADLRARYAGTPVAVTEPLPDYLLSACGLKNRTPQAFSAAIEAGTDVSASTLAATLRLFEAHGVRAVVYNEQTTGIETTRVLAAAAANDIPAVPVAETLPAGATYLSWMRRNLAALRRALAGATP